VCTSLDQLQMIWKRTLANVIIDISNTLLHSLNQEIRKKLLLIGAWRSPRWPGVGRALQRHPFSGLVDSAGELLHTP